MLSFSGVGGLAIVWRGGGVDGYMGEVLGVVGYVGDSWVRGGRG